MRVVHPTQRSAIGFNMTPMIDVVFLLIIFFLVSSHLAKQEAQMQLPLPVAASGKTPSASDGPRVTINVRSGGDLLLAGKPVRPDEVQNRLEAKRAAAGEQLEVRIRSDRRVAYQSVEPILLACARAGIWNVTFAVYRSEDAR